MAAPAAELAACGDTAAPECNGEPAADDFAAATSFARLVDAIRRELAALDTEDPERIEAATAAKLTAMAAVNADVAAGVAPDRALLETARDLNAEAALRAKGKLLGVERRLGSLSALAGRPAPLVYGRNGRWA
ncbi:hypothetical protein IP88_10550 [alpha proteobacterium AAP81b]|nr:hypothetical protein IP88_10550 [alpha proteobacterium AAP81b]